MAVQGKSKTPNQERLNAPTQGDGVTHPTQSTPSLPNQTNSVSIDETWPEKLFNRFFGGKPQQHLKTE
jgi:hypothetical protein